MTKEKINEITEYGILIMQVIWSAFIYGLLISAIILQISVLTKINTILIG